MRYITLENHPEDSRVMILDDDICQTLSSRMGTGGGNVPMVIEVDDAEDSDNLKQRDYKDATDLILKGGVFK